MSASARHIASSASAIADFAVIGAGLVGASVAWGLAKGGAKVSVFDAGTDHMHASAGNFGLVWVQGKGTAMPEYAALTKRSADAWSLFADELACDTALNYERCGGVKIALSEQELAGFSTALQRHHNNPQFVHNDTQIIDQKQLRELLPGVGPDAIGGTWCPHDGHVDSLATLQALHQRLSQNANISVKRQSVESIKTTSPHARFELIGKGTTAFADRIVLAAGLGNQVLANQVGINAQIKPERGQILVTERTPDFLNVACHNVRQTSDGTVMLGDSHEDVGFDLSVTQSVTKNILQRAVRTFPHLAKIRLQRSWGALRVLSADGMPVYQSSSSCPGASLITCHSGVTLAAVHSTEIANVLLTDRLNDVFPTFGTDRFYRTG